MSPQLRWNIVLVPSARPPSHVVSVSLSYKQFSVCLSIKFYWFGGQWVKGQGVIDLKLLSVYYFTNSLSQILHISWPTWVKDPACFVVSVSKVKVTGVKMLHSFPLSYEQCVTETLYIMGRNLRNSVSTENVTGVIDNNLCVLNIL